jgi:uncharacterized protein (TIRG00374 family)
VARLKGAARPLAHLAVALAIFGLVIWRANPWQLGDEYSDFKLWPAAGAVLLNVPVLLLMTLRGRLILGRLRHDIPFLELLPISTLGNVAGSLTPAAAGELLRTPFFKERHEIPYADGFAAVLYERGLSVVVLAASTGAAAAWMTLDVGLAVAVTAAAALLALSAPALAALVLSRLRLGDTAAADGERVALLGRLRRTLGRPLAPLLVLLRDPPGTAVIGLTNLLVFAVMALQFWLVVEALGLDINGAEAWTAMGASFLAAIFTLLPLGLGSMDATIAGIIGSTQHGFHAGAAAAVLLRATATLPLGIAALASYIYLVSARRRRAAGS